MEVRRVTRISITYEFGPLCCKEIEKAIDYGTLTLTSVGRVIFQCHPTGYCPFCGVPFREVV
jgi:hypothetical protein